MDIIKLLEYLQEIIEDSSKIPVTGKVLVDKKEVLDIIEQVITHLPEEFRKAQWVLEEKQRIIVGAKKEAKYIEKESLEKVKRKIENHDIIKEAQIKAGAIIANAQKEAKIIRSGVKEYADQILSQLEKEIQNTTEQMIQQTKKEVEQFTASLEKELIDHTTSIRKNMNELRSME